MCKHVTKLVPQLKPKESCTDVPKEVTIHQSYCLIIFFNNLHLHPPAGVHSLPGQPQEGEEADREEVVLRLPRPRARDRLRQQAAARHTPAAAAHLSRQVRRHCPNR